MSGKSIALIVGGIVMLAIPVILIALPKRAKSDNVPLVSADTPLGLATDDRGSDPTVISGKTVPVRRDANPSSWEEVIRECEPSVAVVKGKVGHGTGFLLPNNVLATNAHVINLEFEENLRVHFPSASQKQQGPYKARFIWADRKRDLAFLNVDCPVPSLDLAERYEFRKGQEVLAIGNPGIGKNDLLPNAVSRGLMSTLAKLDRQLFFQLDIAVNQGNSGGPVLDHLGRVLGMVTAKMRDKEGIAFAIPLEDLHRGYAEVVGQGRESTPELMAWHRGCTVFERLIHICELYLAALEANSKAMDMAVAKGLTPNDGLRAVPEQVRKDVETINKMFADNLEKNLQLTVNEQNLYPDDKERIRKLWDLCREMKKTYDSPSGTLDSYRKKKDQLRQQFEKLLTREPPKKPAKKKSAA